MREFNITFAMVRPNRQAGTTVMWQMALAARVELPPNMVAPQIEPVQQKTKRLTLRK